MMSMEVVVDGVSPGHAKVIDEDGTSLPAMDIKTNSTEEDHEESIKPAFVDGSHEVNGERTETDHVSASIFPKDAVDEWPEPKQVHTFYFVKVQSYEDPKLKAKVEIADKEIQKRIQSRFQITEAVKAKRSERSQVISQLKPLTSENKQYWMVIDEKRKEIGPLQAALGELRNANNSTRDKGVGLCSSEEELNDLIRSLHYRIQHESNTLVEEKQLLKEIKQLEQSREKVIANAAMKAKIQDSYGQKEAIQDQVKLIGGDMDGVRKEQQAIKSQIKHLEARLKAIDNEIDCLQEDLKAVNEKKGKAYETLNELRKGCDDANACFYQNRSLLNRVKDLAMKKDIAALEELSNSEVEKFMSQWSSSKTFREDYERRILQVLDRRQLSRDGRIRNPNEKPILQSPPVNESETAPIAVNAKRAKESFTPTQHDTAASQKIQEEFVVSPEIEPRGKSGGPQDIKNTMVEKTKPKEVDVAKLKELKREEELAKSKLAMERKKKLAEKAAAKAAARAQKEAEKKKEKEKRAKKKAGVLDHAASADEQTETDAKLAEPEEAEAKLVAPIPVIPKEQKEKVRQRNRKQLPDKLPRVILRKKRSHSYLLWAAPAAILAVALIMIGYYYLGRN